MKKLYISGPMTGYPECNYPAFNAAAKEWRALGWEVINPAENFGGDTTLPRHIYMRRDLEQLLSVDAVACLPNWRGSNGALLEVQIARELGLPVFHSFRPPN
jgi:hypothetical protein